MKVVNCFLFFLLFCSSLFAQKGNVTTLAYERAGKATAILKQFSVFGTDSVPFEILRKAKAVGVFNDVTRTSLLFSSGIKAKGLMAARGQTDWKLPIFISFAGSSLEFKLAAKKKFDIVFFVMDDSDLDFLRRKGKLVPLLSLGPVVGGKGADLVLEKGAIIYYTFENGKLSGEELRENNLFSNVILGLDNNLNKALYNKKAQTILAETQSDAKAPAAVEDFRQTVINLLLQNK